MLHNGLFELRFQRITRIASVHLIASASLLVFGFLIVEGTVYLAPWLTLTQVLWLDAIGNVIVMASLSPTVLLLWLLGGPGMFFVAIICIPLTSFTLAWITARLYEFTPWNKASTGWHVALGQCPACHLKLAGYADITTCPDCGQPLPDELVEALVSDGRDVAPIQTEGDLPGREPM